MSMDRMDGTLLPRWLAIAVLLASSGVSAPIYAQFKRGDVNDDGNVSTLDFYLLSDHLFGVAAIPCDDAADVNDDGTIDVSDTLLLLSQLCVPMAVMAIPAPGPVVCGPDPTPDANGCGAYLSCGVGSPAGAPNSRFIRGDCNTDLFVDIGDAIFLLNGLFVLGGVMPCLDACDYDDGGAVDIGDAIAILGLLFVPGSPPPALPFPICGGCDPTEPDGIDCVSGPCP